MSNHMLTVDAAGHSLEESMVIYWYGIEWYNMVTILSTTHQHDDLFVCCFCCKQKATTWSMASLVVDEAGALISDDDNAICTH